VVRGDSSISCHNLRGLLQCRRQSNQDCKTSSKRKSNAKKAWRRQPLPKTLRNFWSTTSKSSHTKRLSRGEQSNTKNNNGTPKSLPKVHQQCGSAASVTSGGNYITTSDSPIPQWRVTDSSSFLSNRPNSTPRDKVSEMARRDTLTNTTALASTLSTTNIDEYSRTPRAQLASDSETKKEALQ
jgi:hypothetical protein